MKRFCKLFEVDDGQVLIIKDCEDDDTPKITMHVGATDSFSTKLDLTYDNSDVGEQKRNDDFESFDQERAERIYESVKKAITHKNIVNMME